MTGNALGYIEAVGLTAAVEAADAAVKSANVRLLGYELAKGDGMTTVKIAGDVGAVKSAVTAAAAAAGKVGRVVSIHVIPRPAAGTEKITMSRDTVGLKKSPVGTEAPRPEPKPEPPKVPKPAADPVSTPETARASEEDAKTPEESKKHRGQPKKAGKQEGLELKING
jgi:microcompartment protein CcmL/EutN